MSDPRPSAAEMAELLRRYDRPGPRYTSYPTAVEFHDGFGHAEYEERLREANRFPEEPLSLYFHLPFCHERCTFCGCSSIVTGKPGVTDAYLDYLKREIAMVGERLADRRSVNQLHWGGGTPTYHTPAAMRDLWAAITEVFHLAPGAEVAVEVDPRVTTREHVDSLRQAGFNRLSLGVQDFTSRVQEAIGRNQGLEETIDLHEYARSAGFDSINVDLVYGLPFQEVETFRLNLEQVIGMRPDRVAVYNFAYIPWVRPHQKGIDADALPSGQEKIELFVAAIEAFTGAGYAQIGMDHFALPDDELAVALREGRLHRNFMGYTVMPAADQIGLGITSIGDLRAAFAQNAKKLSDYYEAIDAGRLPTERGYGLDEDDRIRRHVIMSLMCNLTLDIRDVENRFGIVFTEYFAREMEELALPREHGFLDFDAERIEVNETGRLFLRNVSMIFDRYMQAKRTDGRPVFSQTV